MNKFLALVTVITLNACDNVYDPNMLAKIQKIESDANNIVLNSKCSNKNEIESKALQITAMVISANEAIKNGHVIGLIQYHNSAIQSFNNIKELDEKCRDSMNRKVGTRKIFPNGNVGEWDGVGWVLVEPTHEEDPLGILK